MRLAMLVGQLSGFLLCVAAPAEAAVQGLPGRAAEPADVALLQADEGYTPDNEKHRPFFSRVFRKFSKISKKSAKDSKAADTQQEQLKAVSPLASVALHNLHSHHSLGTRKAASMRAVTMAADLALNSTTEHIGDLLGNVEVKRMKTIHGVHNQGINFHQATSKILADHRMGMADLVNAIRDLGTSLTSSLLRADLAIAASNVSGLMEQSAAGAERVEQAFNSTRTHLRAHRNDLGWLNKQLGSSLDLAGHMEVPFRKAFAAFAEEIERNNATSASTIEGVKQLQKSADTLMTKVHSVIGNTVYDFIKAEAEMKMAKGGSVPSTGNAIIDGMLTDKETDKAVSDKVVSEHLPEADDSLPL